MYRATAALLGLSLALAFLSPIRSQTKDNQKSIQKDDQKNTQQDDQKNIQRDDQKNIQKDKKSVIPPVQPPMLPKLGLWLVVGRDQAGTTWAAPLVFAKDIDGKTNTGFFDWKSNAGVGREVFKGTFDPKTRKIKLQGTHYVFKEGDLVLGTYEGIVSPDGLKLENGTWVGGIGGEWTAVWKAGFPTKVKK